MYRVSESVRSTHSRDGSVVLDVSQGQLFNLNVVGSRILELLKQGSPENEIAETVSREFNQNIETVRGDLTEFMETLKSLKLLECNTHA